MAKDIELWAIDKLVPFSRNARTHSDAHVAQIAGSIREFGFNSPILVDSKAGVIAGHGRLRAARQLHLAQVPVIVLDHRLICGILAALVSGFDALSRTEPENLTKPDKT